MPQLTSQQLTQQYPLLQGIFDLTLQTLQDYRVFDKETVGRLQKEGSQDIATPNTTKWKESHPEDKVSPLGRKFKWADDLLSQTNYTMLNAKDRYEQLYAYRLLEGQVHQINIDQKKIEKWAAMETRQALHEITLRHIDKVDSGVFNEYLIESENTDSLTQYAFTKCMERIQDLTHDGLSALLVAGIEEGYFTQRTFKACMERVNNTTGGMASLSKDALNALAKKCSYLNREDLNALAGQAHHIDVSGLHALAKRAGDLRPDILQAVLAKDNLFSSHLKQIKEQYSLTEEGAQDVGNMAVWYVVLRWSEDEDDSAALPWDPAQRQAVLDMVYRVDSMIWVAQEQKQADEQRKADDPTLQWSLYPQKFEEELDRALTTYRKNPDAIKELSLLGFINVVSAVNTALQLEKSEDPQGAVKENGDPFWNAVALRGVSEGNRKVLRIVVIHAEQLDLEVLDQVASNSYLLGRDARDTIQHELRKRRDNNSENALNARNLPDDRLNAAAKKASQLDMNALNAVAKEASTLDADALDAVAKKVSTLDADALDAVAKEASRLDEDALDAVAKEASTLDADALYAVIKEKSRLKPSTSSVVGDEQKLRLGLNRQAQKANKLSVRALNVVAKEANKLSIEALNTVAQKANKLSRDEWNAVAQQANRLSTAALNTVAKRADVGPNRNALIALVKRVGKLNRDVLIVVAMQADRLWPRHYDLVKEALSKAISHSRLMSLDDQFTEGVDKLDLQDTDTLDRLINHVQKSLPNERKWVPFVQAKHYHVKQGLIQSLEAIKKKVADLNNEQSRDPGLKSHCSSALHANNAKLLLHNTMQTLKNRGGKRSVSGLKQAILNVGASRPTELSTGGNEAPTKDPR